MHITFYGAVGGVTGSCELIDTGRSKVLVDCGLFQGSREAHDMNAEPFPFNPSELDALILTHAHVDHLGRIPYLVKQGFAGRIFATHPTRLLAKLMWQDTADVMRSDMVHYHRVPLYRRGDVGPAFDLVHGVGYGVPVRVTDDVTATFRDAGHVFGSSFVEIKAGERRLVFSGDLGNDHAPILRDTESITAGDVVVMESTYGNRRHEDARFRVDRLKKAIEDTVRRRGVLLIPAFSLERTQEILYELNGLAENGELPPVPIILDSPLAQRMMPIYRQFTEFYDRDAKELRDAGDDFLVFPGLEATKSPEESHAIKDRPKPKVIIAGSGMMHGGRIMSHLTDYLGDPQTTVLVVGFQAAGTVGRALTDGAERVTIDHETYEVKAKVEVIGSYSAHADADKLVRWVTSNGKPRLVVLNHGSDEARAALAERLRGEGIEVRLPQLGDAIEV
jgi:metallo-beta-lactamase family protein